MPLEDQDHDRTSIRIFRVVLSLILSGLEEPPAPKLGRIAPVSFDILGKVGRTELRLAWYHFRSRGDMCQVVA
jgi:hypothetical protein